MYFSHYYLPNRPYGRNEAQNIIKILHVIVVSFTTFKLKSLPAPKKSIFIGVIPTEIFPLPALTITSINLYASAYILKRKREIKYN